MMTHRLLSLLAAIGLAATLPTSLQAQALDSGPEPEARQPLEGSWDFEVAETTIFRFEIIRQEDGEWTGTWSRPSSFNTDGYFFRRMRGPVQQSDSMTGIEFLGRVELSFDDPRPGAIPDIFRFEMIDDDSAEMIYVGTDLAPYPLSRADADAALGDWDVTQVLRRRSPDDVGDANFQARSDAIPADVSVVPEIAPNAVEAEPEEEVSEEDAPEEDVPEEDDSPRISSDFLDGF